MALVGKTVLLCHSLIGYPSVRILQSPQDTLTVWMITESRRVDLLSGIKDRQAVAVRLKADRREWIIARRPSKP
jgi:hypothetical protein